MYHPVDIPMMRPVGVGPAVKDVRGRLDGRSGGGSGTHAINIDAGTLTLQPVPTTSASPSLDVPAMATAADRWQLAASTSAVASAALAAAEMCPAAPRLAWLCPRAVRARIAALGCVSGHRFSHHGNNEHARTHTQHRPTGLPGATGAPWHTQRDEDGTTVRVHVSMIVGNVKVPIWCAYAENNLVTSVSLPSIGTPASLSYLPPGSMCVGMHPSAMCPTAYPPDNASTRSTFPMRALIGRVVVPAIVKTNNHRTSSSAFAFAHRCHVAVPAIVKTNGHKTEPSQMPSIVHG